MIGAELPHDETAEWSLVWWLRTPFGPALSRRVTRQTFHVGRWRHAYEALLARRPLPEDTFMALMGTYPAGGLLERDEALRRAQEMASRRRLIDAAQRVAEAAWDTRHTFDSTRAEDTLRGLSGRVRQTERQVVQV